MALRTACVLLAGATGAPTDLTVVVAQWARPLPAWTARFNTCVYQRHNDSAPAYVPNRGNEAGIYLRYIRDHYHTLSPITVFVQDDAAADVGDRVVCLRRGVDWGWTPVSGGMDVASPGTWTGQWWEHPLGRPCTWHLAADFGQAVRFEAHNNRTLRYFGGAYFAATAEQLRLHPWSAYEAAYRRMVEAPGCADRYDWGGGNAFLDAVPRPNDTYVGERNNWYLSCVFEFSVHWLLGGQRLDMEDGWVDAQWCRRFLHANHCPGSPCGGDTSAFL
jgi:hypothetical protein